MNANRRGFSFIELLIVTAIFTVVVAATLSLAHKAQRSFRAERDFTEASEQARIAMDTIVRYLRQAGNDPRGTLKNADPPIPAVRTGSSSAISFVINSDITGSNGTTGDPDGDVSDPFEQILVLYDGQADTISLNLNDGQPTQVLADHITAFQVQFLDRAGLPTSTDVAQAVITMTAETARNDPRFSTPMKNSISLRSTVFLRNKTLDLYEPPAAAGS